MSSVLRLLTVTAASLGFVLGFDNNRNDNLAVYWGTNSYGATHLSDTANWQHHLAFYCGDNSIDTFPIAFLNTFFDVGGLPSINLANTCNPSDNPVFPGTNLPNCQFLATDIQTCQSRGKIVTISLGGGAGGGTFSSVAQAQAFGTTIWNLFLGGSSSTRPFGNAVLDGVDLDIEGGNTNFFDAFIAQIRSLASGSGKTYYFTAAPQCPYPDAYLGTVLNAASFDAVYVQFYNNYCSLPNFNNPNDWDFSSWDTWAKTVSKNPNVKVYIGAPASPTAAGSGYVDANTLGSIAQQTRSTYSSFGGVMMWDASQAYMNGRYDAAIKSALTNGGGVTPTSSSSAASSSSVPPSSTTSSTTPASTTTAASGSCAGVAAWSSTVAYQGGQQVTYKGHLWTANWWSFADAPDGPSGDWKDSGPCPVTPAIATSAGFGGGKAPASASVTPASKSTASPPAKAATGSAAAAGGPSSVVKHTAAAASPTIALNSSSPEAKNVAGAKNVTETATARHSRFFRL